ncbi:hypothetical protein [Streptomyces sp. NPDC088736]|uniref:hypothetical protein n=1 Tax=Streptomyces sp. NPDC088736 TaxID=3365881 RepID=UPI00382D669C
MSANLPVIRPQCAQHGAMEFRLGQTLEQTWCGAWYACSSPRCQTAALIPSMGLTAQLITQERTA